MNNIDNGHNEGIVPITPIAPTNGEQGGSQSSSGQTQGNVVTPAVGQPANNQAGVNGVQPHVQSTADVMPKIEPTLVVPVNPEVNNTIDNSNSGIVNASSQPSTGVPIPSIISSVPNGASMRNGNNDSVISVTPGNIIPESKDNNSNVQSNVSQGQQNIIQPELKIDGSSPFDIGIGGNNISNQGVIQNNVTPTPIVPNNINNSNDSETIAVTSSNVNKEPDINMSTSSVSSDDNVVSVGKYLLHIILFCIPVIGFIMLIVKALDKKDKNISNFAKAQLILGVIGVVIIVVITVISVMATSSAISTTYDKYNNASTNYNY